MFCCKWIIWINHWFLPTSNSACYNVGFFCAMEDSTRSSTTAPGIASTHHVTFKFTNVTHIRTTLQIHVPCTKKNTSNPSIPQKSPLKCQILLSPPTSHLYIPTQYH
eukprot:217230_1